VDQEGGNHQEDDRTSDFEEQGGEDGKAHLHLQQDVDSSIRERRWQR
jgi:hypothetical protein